MNEALSPLAVATVEASNGATPSWSTKIVAVAGVLAPIQVNVSNTTIKAGVFRKDELVADWRFATERSRLADEYGMLLLSLFQAGGIAPSEVKGVSISCVVPPLRAVFELMSQRYLKVEPLIVGPQLQLGLRLAVDNPKGVGSDRIVNTLATHRLYGGPAIAIAFGTATVFDCISASGEYLGCAIAPGMVVALESLTRSAAPKPRTHAVRGGSSGVHRLGSVLMRTMAPPLTCALTTQRPPQLWAQVLV